jgi:hypothetical protein
MKRLSRLVPIVILMLVLISLLAACAHSIGSRTPTGTNQPPAAAQPAKIEPADHGTVATDAQADDIEQALNDLDNQLRATDTLDDLK